MRLEMVIAAAVAVLGMAGACMKENGAAESGSEQVKCTLVMGLDTGWGQSKSVISGKNVETKITDLMIAVYRDGKLFYHKYYNSAPAQLELLLYRNKRFKIYAMANMGDFSGTLPSMESDILTVNYYVNSYSSLSEKGFPMASVKDYIPGVTTDSQILLGRLFAKVTANLECKWPGGRIMSARLQNVNRRLQPFGNSAIVISSDVYRGDSDIDISHSTSATMVLYVTENLQGEIAGITDSNDKTGDRTPEVEAKKDCLTYLEVQVQGSSLYQGTMVYRSYLGDNATDNFDIERNRAYIWNIDYYEDNLCRDEWKYDNSLTDMRNLTADDHIYVIPGQTVTLGDHLESNMDPSTLKWSVVGSTGASSMIETLSMTNLSNPSFRVRDGVSGGSSLQVLVEPQSNSQSGLRKTITVYIKDPLDLGMTLQNTQDTYPYKRLVFHSTERMSELEASSLSQALNTEVSSANVLQGEQTWGYEADSNGYYLVFKTVPTRPGDFHYDAVSATGIESFDCSVLAPQLLTSTEEVHLDVNGDMEQVILRLCDVNGNSLSDGVNPAQSAMRFLLEANHGTDVTLKYNHNGGSGYTSTTRYYNAYVGGFRGLEGLDLENFTFGGLNLVATASFTYPNGYSVQKGMGVTVDIPSVSTDWWDGATYTYRVEMGQSNTVSYVTDSPECYPEYMLDWPTRTITVDLSRGGGRNVPTGLEVWKADKSRLTLSRYGYNQAGKVSFAEDLGQWGPVYYGVRIVNSHSKECRMLAHSIIRIYCHYTVFATFDVRQDITAQMGETWGDINWNTGNLDWSCFRVSLKNTFGKGPYGSLLSPLVVKTAQDNTAPYPVYEGFNKITEASGWGSRDYCYTTNGISGYLGYPKYYIGYKATSDGYDILYRMPYMMYDIVVGQMWEILNWRAVAASNVPMYSAGTGNFNNGTYHCTTLTKKANGKYNFSIMSVADKNANLENEYLDADGDGYQYLHLFWEPRKGIRSFSTKRLNATRWPSSRPYVYMMNGWYDPSLYYSATNNTRNGIPIAAQYTGMYFYNTADGYYPYDHPSSGSSFNATDPDCMEFSGTLTTTYKPKPEFRNTVEWFDFGTLAQRDIDAARN